jgi:hypothetical protein
MKAQFYYKHKLFKEMTLDVLPGPDDRIEVMDEESRRICGRIDKKPLVVQVNVIWWVMLPEGGMVVNVLCK